MQVKAAMKVNQEMLRFYWSLGKDMVEMRAESRWGSKFYDSLSKDLVSVMPEPKKLFAKKSQIYDSTLSNV